MTNSDWEWDQVFYFHHEMDPATHEEEISTSWDEVFNGADSPVDIAADSNVGTGGTGIVVDSVDVDPDWNAAFHEELLSSQEETQAMEEACALASDSGSEDGSSCSSGSGWKLTAWWSQVLLKAAQGLGLDWPGVVAKPLYIVSGCTGCSAEAATLKAWDCPTYCFLDLVPGFFVLHFVVLYNCTIFEGVPHAFTSGWMILVNLVSHSK